jgi:hypothetical protein
LLLLLLLLPPLYTTTAMKSHRSLQIMAAMGMYVFANCFGYPDLSDMPSCDGDLTEHKLLLCMSKNASNTRAEKDKYYVSTGKHSTLKELPLRNPFRLALSTAATAGSSDASSGDDSSSSQQKQMWYVDAMLRSLAVMESLGGITKLPHVKPVKGEHCSTSEFTVVTA